MLEEVSVSSQGEERIQLLRRWIASLREIEKLDSSSADYDEKYVEEPHTTTYRNDSPGKLDVVIRKNGPIICCSPILSFFMLPQC